MLNGETVSVGSITVYDMYGRAVVQVPYSETAIIQTGSLPTGIYLLHVELTNGEKAFSKIVKN